MNIKRWLKAKLRSYLENYTYVKEDFRTFGNNVLLDADIFISNPEYVSLGDNVVIYRGTKIFCGPGKLKIGNNSHLAGDVYVNCVKGNIVIGDGVAVGPKTVMVTYSNYYEPGKKIVECKKCSDITIGNDIFIGASVVIPPGVTISDGAIIGAGTVVTKDVNNCEIFCGNPGVVKKIRQL